MNKRISECITQGIDKIIHRVKIQNKCTMAKDTHAFNQNQLKAVNWEMGPLLVRAGPGAGKTKVLTHRMARLVEESAGESFQILGLTHTIKAAREMEERTNRLIPDASSRINISTYHAFSTAILRQHGHHIGTSPDFAILAQDEDRMRVLSEAVKEAGLSDMEKYNSKKMLPLVTRLTEQNIPVDTAKDALQSACPNDYEHIGEIYKHYRRLLIKGNELDFGGLIAEAFKLITTTAAAKLIRCVYPYICVDEFQDTNYAQYQLLCSIVDPDTKNLFVSVDDNQTSYEWNGARHDRIKQLQKRFGMNILDLPENYRCPSSVVNMANRLIAINTSHDKAESILIKPDVSDTPPSVRIKKFDTAEDEADWIAGDIAMLPIESRQKCAVLARTRNALKDIIGALERRGIQGVMSNRKDMFENERMAWIHAIIRLANSRHDERRLRQVCKIFHMLEGVDVPVEKIIIEATAGDGDYLRAWQSAMMQKELNPTTMSFLEHRMPNLIDRLQALDFVNDCFAWFEKRQNECPTPDYDTQYMTEKKNWDAFVSDVSNHTDHKQITLSALLQHIDLCPKEPPAPRGSIACHTIFASKGMEFDHVYLIRLVEDELPDWRAAMKDNESDEMQEERRICFVGITRAQKRLTLTWPRSVYGRIKKPSRFLAEMNERIPAQICE